MGRRTCCCGCGRDCTKHSVWLNARRVNRGSVDSLGPISCTLEPGKRRRIQDDVRDNKGDWLLSVVHVHPEDLRWTKKGWLQLKD